MAHPRNIKVEIQYLGTNYHGWQLQSNGPTIQGELERALSKVLQEDVRLIGSGRTDAGVHAIRQVANFFTRKEIPLVGILKGANSLLPDDIAILEVEEVPEDFHARKSAKKKCYLYRIVESNSRLPLFLDRAWVLGPGLDIQRMGDACKLLVGTHDFKAFQRSGSSVKTTTRTIYLCEVSTSTWEGHRCIEILVAANGFLRYMVRNIVGILVKIGRGDLGPDAIEIMLNNKERTYAFKTAPACGLYLKEVYY